MRSSGNQSGILGYASRALGRCFKNFQDASGAFLAAPDAVGNADPGEAISGKLQSGVLLRESFDLCHKIQMPHTVIDTFAACSA